MMGLVVAHRQPMKLAIHNLRPAMVLAVMALLHPVMSVALHRRARVNVTPQQKITLNA